MVVQPGDGRVDALEGEPQHQEGPLRAPRFRRSLRRVERALEPLVDVSRTIDQHSGFAQFADQPHNPVVAETPELAEIIDHQVRDSTRTVHARGQEIVLLPEGDVLVPTISQHHVRLPVTGLETRPGQIAAEDRGVIRRANTFAQTLPHGYGGRSTFGCPGPHGSPPHGRARAFRADLSFPCRDDDYATRLKQSQGGRSAIGGC